MAWIETTPSDDADDVLRALYREVADPETGDVDNILAIHSLNPDGLGAHLALYRTVMRGTRTLPKVDREMIAVVVSIENACHY